MSEIDHALEEAIDRVGRDRVFARARAVGWKEIPPKWVWWTIVAELMSIEHASDCATNNGPALPRGPCDCGKVINERQ